MLLKHIVVNIWDFQMIKYHLKTARRRVKEEKLVNKQKVRSEYLA